jgi:hypothetical protein
LCFIDNSGDARSAKPLHQPMQLPQPRRVQHRHRALQSTDAEHVRRIGADRARRAIRQLDHQQQHAVPSLKRPRRQQAPEQRMRLRDHPHIARQHSTQLLQSVAFTPGTGKTMLAIGLARAAAEAGHRVYFTTADELAKRCRKADLEGRWATTMRFFCGPAYWSSTNSPTPVSIPTPMPTPLLTALPKSRLARLSFATVMGPLVSHQLGTTCLAQRAWWSGLLALSTEGF